MKLLFFCNLVPRKMGAFETLMIALAGRLKRQGDEFFIVYGGEPICTVAEELRRHDARWTVIRDWSTRDDENIWRFPIPAVRLLLKEGPDVTVIHFGDELPTLVAMLLARMGGVRTRWVWQQDQQISDPTWLTSRLSSIGLIGAACDHVVAMYDGGRESMLRRGVPGGKMSVIRNGVAARTNSTDRNVIRKRLGVDDSTVLLGTVGSLIPRKRISFLLNVVAAAPQSTHLAVVGDGPLRATLIEEARGLGVADRVHWTGFVTPSRDVLAAFDIYVHAALAEASSYAVAEAMAEGLPIVITHAGAADELIVEGETGFVTARDDRDGFIRQVTRLAADGSLRGTMGAAALVRWATLLDVEKSAEAYVKLYQELGRR